MAEKLKGVFKGHHHDHEEDTDSVVGFGIGHTQELSPYGTIDTGNDSSWNATDSIALGNEESNLQLQMDREALIDCHGNLKSGPHTIQVSDDEEELHSPQRESTLISALAEIVQHPPVGPFQREDLIWRAHRTSGKGIYHDSDIAVIPWNRLEDFVAGEQNNENFPCKFTKETVKVNKPGTLLQPRANSGSKVIRYRCHFGPEDHSGIVSQDMEALLHSTQKKRRKVVEQTKRRGKKVIPEYDAFRSQNTLGGKKKRIGKSQSGMSIKRGCQRSFIVKQPYLDNSLCQIIYCQTEHVNKDGKPCHGSTIGGFRHAMGSNLSDDMKRRLSTMLNLGLSPSQVMAQHKKDVREMAILNMPVTWDTFVMPHDVRNLSNKRATELWQKHPNDPRSVSMWMKENMTSVFYYKEHALIDLNVTVQDDAPFTLGIQTEWQLEMMVKHGQGSALAFDATFGTTETRYPLYTIMVFDEWRNGIPVGFFIISRTREKDLQIVLEELKDTVQAKASGWAPSSIIVDNAQAEINVLRSMWPEARIFLCLWHVRKNWAENAVKKIRTIGERTFILKALGDIMYGKGMSHDDSPIEWAHQQLDNLAATRPLAAAFMKYITDHWRGKAEMWCTRHRSIPHAGQNTNAAIESYHGNLKSILHSAKEKFNGRRMDWLVYHLVGDVLSHYWYNVHLKKFGFVRNTRQEFIVVSAVIRAKSIPDSHVLLYPDGDDVALVASVNNQPKVWTVHSPDSEWAQCNCPIANEGMICKHSIKVFKMLHPDIEDGLIIREAGTRHGIDKDTPLLQGLSSSHGGHCAAELPAFIDNDVGEMDIQCNEEEPTVSKEKDPKMCGVVRPNPRVLFEDLLTLANEHNLHDHLVADLQAIRGKYNGMVARGVANVGGFNSTRSFPELPGDNSLIRRKGFLEPKSRRVKN